MEQMLDLPVQSAPLKHLTKTRIRNNSRKVLLPSKSHLKRNLIGESIYLQRSHLSSVKREMNTNAIPVTDGVKLKLPPPPVAKKPKVNLYPSARKLSNAITNLHDGDEGLLENKQKPVIAPKPIILRSTSSTSKEMNNNYRDTALGLNLNVDDNKELVSESPKNDLNSPTKTYMSFSERLRASSLSRRKEGSTSDASQGRFRSQIISPIRRGSRSFLTPDSPLDNDAKPKSREFIFKRFSSEASLKLEETKEDDNKKEDFDLEKFKNLRLEAVDPVIVDSILSTNNSFEEDDVVKDSFDSGELFKAENSASKPGGKERTYFQSISSIDTPFDKLDLGENFTSSELKPREQERPIFVDKTASDETIFVEKDKGSTNSSDMHDNKKHTLNYIDMGNSSAYQAKSVDGKTNETIMNTVDSKQVKTSQNLRSPKTYGRSKGGNNIRKKFTPVGLEETAPLSDGSSKTKSELKVVGDRKSSDANVLNSVDTDSSFEHVTPDIELDSTFEIPLQKNSHVLLNSSIERTGNKKLIENEELTFFPDSSSSPPLIVPEYDDSNGIAWDVSLPKTGVNSVDNMESELFMSNADAPDYVMQDEDTHTIKDDELSLETVPSLDVEMLPFVPPPPMDEDAFGSDEDMAFSIIDPPTIYGDDGGDDDDDDDDDDVEFATNIDLLSTKDDVEQCNNLLSNRDENMEEECEDIKGESKNSSYENIWSKDNKETGFSQGSKKDSDIDAEKVHDAVAPYGDKNMVNFNEISEVLLSKDISSLPKSNVLSIAKKFDAVASDTRDNYKPPVPAKPANLSKKLSIIENKINNPEISRNRNLAPPPAQDQSSVSSKSERNGSHSAIEISEKGQERRRSFSDRVTSGVDGHSVHESFSDGVYEDYLHETDAKIEPLLLMNDESSALMKSWLDQPREEVDVEQEKDLEKGRVSGHQTSESNDLIILETSKNLPTSDHSEDEITSKFILPNSSSSGCDEVLPVHGESLSRKSSLGVAKDVKCKEELETKRDPRSRWSSFSSTSSDDKFGEKKVNIVKLLRERAQSDANIDNDDDIIGTGFPDVDDRWISNGALDVKSDDENEGKHVDDLGDVLLQDDSKFESTPLDEWTAEDVGDWLEMIGLADLRSTFEEKNVDGQQLQAIDLQLLDEIGITDVDDRELILSEIYALKNPEDFDIEMSLLDALDNASGYDREKMLAVLEALKMSSEDQENRYLPSSTPPQLSSGVKTATSQNSKKVKGDYRRAMSEHKSSSGKLERDEERSKSASPTKRSHDIWDQGGVDSDRTNDGSKKASMKKRSFLKEAFSFRRKRSGKLSKLFSSRKKLVDSSLKYLLQTTPQGVIKIWTTQVNEIEADNVPLLVTSTTTSLEVTKTVLEKLELAVDVNCFYVAQSHSTKSVPEIVLKDDDCPLVFQCRWPDAERYRFELKKQSEGSVIIAFSEEGNDERSVKIDTVMKTKCSEIIAIALKKLQKNDQVNSFSLYKMKNMNKQGHSNIPENNSQIPMDAQLLKLAPSTMQPAVYKLVRVNFLGSPEKSFKPEQSQTIKKLEIELREKEKQLMRSNELNSSIEAKLQEITQQNEFLKQKFKDKNEDVARLENIADSLRLELDQRSDGLSNVIESSDQNQKEKLVKKLSHQEMKTKSLEEWIQNLEKALQQKEEEVRRLQDCQVKIGNYKNKEITERSMKLKEMEGEAIKLKSRIVEVENNSLEAKIQFTEREGQLNEENQALKSEVEQLKMGALRRESEDEKQNQENNKKYGEEMKHLQEELNIKQKMLDELKIVNEDLKNKIISLERSIKQKDRLISDTSSAQNYIEELRRELEISSKEASVKMKESEDARHKNRELAERFEYEMKQKDHELEEARTELSEMLRQNHEIDEERKILKSKLRDMEVTSRGKEQKLEELNDVHQEYKEQIQKMRKLERELSLRSDEIEKLNQEKDESLEDLRSHAESLEQKLIEKDAKILDLEFRMEKVERDLREAENLADDEIRNKNRLSIAIEDGVQKVKELTVKIDDYRRLIGEKDKTIQVLRDSQNDTNENIRRELSTSKRILHEKEKTIEQIRKTFDEERMEMKSHFETLQELVNTKETKWREKESRLVEEKEAQRSLFAQMEEKLNEKDATVRKLEAKISKLEKMARDNMKKFEKFMSDKDRMLKQVKEESQKDIAELKSKIRQMDDNLTAKEKHVMQLNRSGSIKNEYEIKLRQKEEENKQHKFLLERLMSVANSRDPRILEEFENSFGQTSKPRDDKRPLLSKPDDDWC